MVRFLVIKTLLLIKLMKAKEVKIVNTVREKSDGLLPFACVCVPLFSIYLDFNKQRLHPPI